MDNPDHCDTFGGCDTKGCDNYVAPIGKRTVAVSGGFDPLHVGHARMFEEAAKLGTRLVVILNNDNWLLKKKGYVFMPEKERAELIEMLNCVDEVVISGHSADDPDSSVCRELERIKPDVFANGGDRESKLDIPEKRTCEVNGITMKFGVGGGKVQSSSELVNIAMSRVMWEQRPWGRFSLLQKYKTWWAKSVYIKPGGKLSLQRHAKRDEIWVCVEGEAQATSGSGTPHALKVGGPPVRVTAGTWHRLFSEKGAVIVEIALGEPVETDIERKEDEYGRV